MQDEVSGELDGWMAEALPVLTLAERTALLKWQGRDRYYTQIQRYLREGPNGDARLERVVQTLVGVYLHEELCLPFSVSVWRGVRASAKMLAGTPPVVGSRSVLDGLLATTTDRAVAESQFTIPPGAGGGMLLQIKVPAGHTAVWMPVAGKPNERDQKELLLGHRTELIVRSMSTSGSIPVMTLEVVSS